MATKQGIWDQALGRIRAQPSVSTSITSSSPRQDVACDREYTTALEALLAAFPWKFSTQWIELTEFGSTNAPTPKAIWDGAFLLADSDQANYNRVIKVFEVRHAGSGVRLDEWEWVTAKSGSPAAYQQFIFTTTADKIHVKAGIAASEAEFPEYFTDVVAWHLASAIAMDLTGNADVANRCEVKAAQTLIDAKITDGGLQSTPSRMRVRAAYSPRLARHRTAGQVEGEAP